MEPLNKTTLGRTVKTDIADKIKIEVGDSKQVDFKPQVKIMRWDNEVNFSMRAEEKAGATHLVENGVSKYITDDYEVHQYEKLVEGEDGYEFEWVLKSQPVSNVMTATISTKELDFFYQPELTADEIAEGAERPENVVGSYAIYHSSKRDNIVGGKEYKTGKALHIYRPEAVDADGNKAWCELYIDSKAGLLTVTVPEKFLAKAAYPVVVDPTFGYTSIGGTSSTGSLNGVRVCGEFTLPEYAKITKLTKYAGGNAASSNHLSVIYGIESDPNKSLLTDAGISTLLTTTVQWNDLPWSSPQFLSAGNYYLGFLHETSTKYYYDVSTQKMLLSTKTYPTPSNPMGTVTTFTRTLSLYATYTASFNPAIAHRRLLVNQ